MRRPRGAVMSGNPRQGGSRVEGKGATVELVWLRDIDRLPVVQ